MSLDCTCTPHSGIDSGPAYINKTVLSRCSYSCSQWVKAVTICHTNSPHSRYSWPLLFHPQYTQTLKWRGNKVKRSKGCSMLHKQCHRKLKAKGNINWILRTLERQYVQWMRRWWTDGERMLDSICPIHNNASNKPSMPLAFIIVTTHNERDCQRGWDTRRDSSRMHCVLPTQRVWSVMKLICKIGPSDHTVTLRQLASLQSRMW